MGAADAGGILLGPLSVLRAADLAAAFCLALGGVGLGLGYGFDW